MRNTTKLKAILKDYTVDFSMNDGSNIIMSIFAKEMDDSKIFENESYSVLISKAYSYANKQKKGTSPESRAQESSNYF
ncbi:MAG TPA: hypothetical protein VIJ57_05880 [Hanamia sp.]